MPISVSDLVSERRTIAVPIGRGRLEVTYRPQELTPAREEEIAEQLDNNDAKSSTMLTMFVDLVAAWDLTGPLVDRETDEVLVEDDVSIPLTPDVLRHVPSAVISTVFQAVYDDMNDDSGKKKRSGRSGGGSFSQR